MIGLGFRLGKKFSKPASLLFWDSAFSDCDMSTPVDIYTEMSVMALTIGVRVYSNINRDNFIGFFVIDGVVFRTDQSGQIYDMYGCLTLITFYSDCFLNNAMNAYIHEEENVIPLADGTLLYSDSSGINIMTIEDSFVVDYYTYTGTDNSGTILGGACGT